jgi:hypothetical protein
MWSWKSQDTLFRASIILEHSRILIIGLAAKVLALIILRNFDGLKALFAPVVGRKLINRPCWDVAFSFADDVNAKHLLLRELCFIGVTNHFGRGFLLCGL